MIRIYQKLFAALILLAGSFSIASVHAQNHSCGFDELLDQNQQQNPAVIQAIEKAELGYQEYTERSNRVAGGVVTIPVVVHVIQSSNHNLVTMVDIQSQIDILNEDYRKMANTPGDGLGVDTYYEFCLASIDPNGCPTDGVIRIVDPVLAYHNRDVAQAQMKGASQWSPYKYLNMWVPRVIDTPGQGGGSVIGYATFPTNLAIQSSLDGVVIHSGFFGRYSDQQYQGRTATHEVGHWMGLYHTFQGGCTGSSSTNCTSQGDRVCDTPQAMEANYQCPSGVNSCVDTPVDNPDQIDNYMDYADGTCQSRFTQGQKDRMDYFMVNFRGQLIAPANTVASGCDGSTSPGCAPDADFSAKNLASCPNNMVEFTDESFGPATSWSWTFQGGTPATSTDQNPTVSYSAAGTYTVTLDVTNSFGTASETKTSYITITDPMLPPLVESFEASTNLPSGWTSINFDESTGWEVVAVPSTDGNNAIKVNNYGNFNNGSNDDLISPSLNLSHTTEASISFDRCYKRYNPQTLDTLRVDVSTDCGDSWTNLYDKTGIDLVTVGGFASAFEFVPSPTSDWFSDTISLDSFVGFSEVKIRFRCTSGAAQALYLDNINMNFTAVSAAEAAENNWSLNVGPNPFTDRLDINFEMVKPSNMEVKLLDITGKVLYRHNMGRQAPGMHRESVDATALNSLAPGIYFLRAETQFGTIVRKLVKMN